MGRGDPTSRILLKLRDAAGSERRACRTASGLRSGPGDENRIIRSGFDAVFVFGTETGKPIDAVGSQFLCYTEAGALVLMGCRVPPENIAELAADNDLSVGISSKHKSAVFKPVEPQHASALSIGCPPRE